MARAMDGTNIFCVVLLALVIYAHGQEVKGRLVKQLLKKYEKSGGKLVIPDNNGAVNVSHSIALRRIISLENQILTIDTFVSMRWQDYRLTWDPEMKNITTIRIPSSYLWHPDIMLYNNADEYNGIHGSDINMVITYDGTVFYLFPAKIKSFCNARVSLLRRKQRVKCDMKFSSWTHDGLSLDLFNEGNTFDMTNYDASFNRKWKVASAKAKRNELIYPGFQEPYIDLIYTLSLKRTGRN